MIRRNRFFACGIILLLLAVFGILDGTRCFLVPSATAEEGRELLKIQMTVRPETLVEPGDVMLSFVIENTSAVDALNVYLSSSDGLLSEPFGRIAAGETQSFNRQHSVTQEELDAGEITYTISHDDPFDPEGKVNYTTRAEIRRGDSLPQAEFTRRFSARYARVGDTLTITYRIRNTGNVALVNLRVQDVLGDFTGRIERLEVGESRTLISRASITEETVSSAALDYQMDASEEIFSCTLSDAPIHIAHPGMEVQFSAGISAFSKSTADVVLLMINTGNVDYRNVCITDDIYGGVIADSIIVPAGGDPVEVSHAYPIREDAGFRWRITGVTESGEKINFVTEDAMLSNAEKNEAALLMISAVAQTPCIRRSGNVTVTVRIDNMGGTDAKDILLCENEIGPLRRYEIIPADGVAERDFSFRVTEDTSYNFTLSYTDENGQTQRVDCAPVDVTIRSDGVLPEGAVSGLIELTGSSIKIGGSSTFAILLIAGCVVLLVLIVMLLIASHRARIEKQLRIAAEKQRRREEMGKTNRFTPVRAPKNKSKGRN